MVKKASKSVVIVLVSLLLCLPLGCRSHPPDAPDSSSGSSDPGEPGSSASSAATSEQAFSGSSAARNPASGQSAASSIPALSDPGVSDTESTVLSPERAEWEKQAYEEAKSRPTTTATINFNTPSIYSSEDKSLYNAGYDGWKDITDPKSVTYLKNSGIEKLRISLMLSAVTKASAENINIYYSEPRDVGKTFVDQIRIARQNGWTPLIAPSNNHALPEYFHGDISNWYRFNHDGSQTDGISDQMRDYAEICGNVARELKKIGITGLAWETFFECDGSDYTVDLHYLTAKAIKEADPTAIIIGPATFPGWAVEEGFLKPYLTKYGTDYLDGVSIHLYGTNDAWARTDLWDYHTDIITMRRTDLLNIIMESASRIPETSKKVREILDSPVYNPGKKKIDILFTEFDANAYSPYQRVPVNQNYPNYSIDSDCYINTNYFGGVFTANCLLQAAIYSPVDDMFRFTTRAYYGLLDHDYTNNEEYYRTPVYFSFLMLQERAHLTPGATTYAASNVRGPTDNATLNIGEVSKNYPYITFAGVKNGSDQSVIILNRSSEPLNVELTIRNSQLSKSTATRYLFSKHTTAQYIGRGEGCSFDGYFESPGNDLVKNTCLTPYDTVSFTTYGKDYIYSGVLDGYSYVILELK